jgi:CRISPR-associated protein Csc1
MSKAIPLKEHGIRLFACRLFNHDYLWFSSFEISRVSTTLPIIHNYAICYSMADCSYGVYIGSRPRYEEDLKEFNLYATPGICEQASRTRITYNAIDSKTLLTERSDRLKSINTPDLGWRIYLKPVFLDKRLRQQQGFLCYLFTFDSSMPKGLTRLGKKGTAFRIYWEEIENPLAIFKEEGTRPTHPVNPLDITGKVISYDPISLPPHMLFRTAEIKEDWFVFSEKHCVHLPGRVKDRVKG